MQAAFRFCAIMPQPLKAVSSSRSVKNRIGSETTAANDSSAGAFPPARIPSQIAAKNRRERQVEQEQNGAQKQKKDESPGGDSARFLAVGQGGTAWLVVVSTRSCRWPSPLPVPPTCSEEPLA